MQIDAVTDLTVVPFGKDRMALFDNETGGQIAAAQRTDGVWTITAPDVETDAQVSSREDAITALVEHAIARPGAKAGYSAMVPHGLAELP